MSYLTIKINYYKMKKQYYILIFLIVSITSSCVSTHPDLNDGLYAQLETNKGDILIDLTFKETPVTVANFVSLSEGKNKDVDDQFKNKKYYDGLIFHRVIENFMIQGGDPTGTGRGGPGYNFKDEFSENLLHDGPGILSMANSGPKTNGSQFFITHKETPWLNGKHTVFGKVVKGQEIVDSIEQNDTIKSVTIIRNGRDAKRFNAPKIFSNHFKEDKILEDKKAEELKNVKIGKNTIIGSNSIIESGVTIGKDCVIGSGVIIKKSIINKNSKVNHLSYIGDTLIGKKSNIGAGTITCNYDGIKKSKTNISDNVFIGSNSSLVAPVKIDKNSVVGAGSVITKNVKKKTLALTRASQLEIKNYRRKKK